MHTIEECILMCWYPVFSAQTCGILTPLNLVSAIGKRGRKKKKERENSLGHCECESTLSLTSHPRRRMTLPAQVFQGNI